MDKYLACYCTSYNTRAYYSRTVLATGDDAGRGAGRGGGEGGWEYGVGVADRGGGWKHK